MLPALYPDPLMLSCGFLPDEGTVLAVGRLAPANVEAASICRTTNGNRYRVGLCSAAPNG